MKRDVRKSALSVAAAVAVLGLVAGCGGGSGGGDPQPGGKKKSGTPAAKALSKSELQQLALEQGEVEGFTVKKGSAKDMAAIESGTTKPAECRPLSDMVVNSAVGDPAAVVLRDAAEERAPAEPITNGDGEVDQGELENFEDSVDNMFDMTLTKIGVSSYDGDAAASAMDDLRSTLDSCKGGFTVSGEKQKIARVQGDAPALGADEAVTFSVTVDDAGKTMTSSKFAVYRDGNTVAYFMALSFAQAAGGDFEVPQVLVEAQLAKLT